MTHPKTAIMRLIPFLLLFFLWSCGADQVESKGKKPESAPKKEELPEAAKQEAPQVEPAKQEVASTEAAEEGSNEYDDIDWVAYEQSMTKDFSFVILISTKSYDAALRRAKDASEKLGYPLDLRELHPNEETGLSLPAEVCAEICGGGVVEYPHYLPRDSWGDTKYVSVEYSDGFHGFTKGYYIVVVASGEKGDPVVEEALNESRKFYSDAYAKTCGVWMGCGC